MSMHKDECKNRTCSGCGPDSDRAKVKELRAVLNKITRPGWPNASIQFNYDRYSEACVVLNATK